MLVQSIISLNTFLSCKCLDISKVFGRVGIMAGASTPKSVIDEVFKAVSL